MSRITPLAALTLLALTPAPPAAATNLPIDDFEVLPFDVAQNGPGDTSEVQFVPPAWIGGHLAATTREIVCAVGPTGSDQSTTAILNTVGPGFDSAAIVNVPPTGHASLVYELGYSANLTVGGTVDRLEAAFTYPSAAQVTAVLVDENQSSASFTAPRPIGGPTEFPLAAFGGVDVENIVTIRFDFDDPGIYACYAIRLRGEGSVGIDFEIHEEATFTPPLPSAPLTATLFLPDTAEPIFDLALTLVNADAGFVPELTMDFQSQTTLGNETAYFPLTWTDFAPFEPMLMSIAIDVSPAAGGWVPELYPPDPIHGPEGIALTFPTMLRDGPGGGVLGASESWITIDVGPQQDPEALTFESVSVTPNVGRGGSTTGFVVSFLLLPGAAGVETIWPILDVAWWTEWSPITSTNAPIAAPTSASPALTAVPSVTRGATVIRLASPPTQPSRILVHDVLGRRVDVLFANEGQESIRWDGRDRDGVRLPAGVYFVNLDGSLAGGTRVVLRH